MAGTLGCASPNSPPPLAVQSSTAALNVDGGFSRCWVDRDGDFIAEGLGETPCTGADGGWGEIGCPYFTAEACPDARQTEPQVRTVYDPRDVARGSASPRVLGTVSSFWTHPPPDSDVRFLDCDDFDALVSPRLPEVAFDARDNDCDGVIDEHGFLPSKQLPAPGTTNARGNVHPILVQVNDVAADAWLADPTHTMVGVEVSVRRAAEASGEATVQAVDIAKSYDPVSHVLTVTLPPNGFLPNKVYALQLLLHESADPTSPLLGPALSLVEPPNDTYFSVSGPGPLAAEVLSDWTRAYLIEGFSELVRYQRGETGWAGTLWPNGEKWGAGKGTFQYCNFGPEWMGKQTSAAFSPDGGTTALWRGPGFISKRYRDLTFDGECTATGPNCLVDAGTCVVVDPEIPAPTPGAAINCSAAAWDFGWGVRDDDDGVFFADDGLGGQGGFYANPSEMAFERWLAGDVEHLQWASGDWHWAVFLDYDPQAEWTCADGTATTGVLSHLNFNGCGNGVCVTRLGVACPGFRLDDGTTRLQVVERMHHRSPFTD